MMRIEFQDGKRQFTPRERVAVAWEWTPEEAAAGLEIRLIWFTTGKGTPEVKVIERQQVAGARAGGREDFSFLLPESPYSFSGKLVRLAWAIEADAGEGTDAVREEITVSPAGTEIRL
jgi:hypothetical protein